MSDAPHEQMTTTPDGPPSGVVFDLGNVLVRWDPAAAIAAGVGAEEAGRFLAADDFDFPSWNHLQDAGRPWAEALAEVRRTHPHWAAHAAAYHAHFPASLAELSETSAIVDELHAADVPLYGLTNWSDELFPHALARFEVLRRLRRIVVSGAIGAAKPDPRAYRAVAEVSGLPLDRLLFVDDSPTNVAAAADLGMDAIVFTGAADLRAALRRRRLPVAPVAP